MRFLSRSTSRLLVAVFVPCIALYIAVIVAKPGAFFADDSYFYFQVAWNFAHGLGSTFNGVMDTNGYHPLWMLVCAAVSKLSPSKGAAIHGVAVALCLCDLLTLMIVRRILAKVADDAWWAALALLIPFEFLSQLGTEGALSGCMLAATALAAFSFAAEPSPRRGLLFSLIAALAVLSRLDNIFIEALVWLAVPFAVPTAVRPRVLRIQLLCVPVPLALCGGYLASNLHYFGVLQPISGLVKSHPAIRGHLGNNLPHTAWLGLGVIVPSIALLAFKRRDLFFRAVEVPFSIGVILHACYIAFRMSGETRWSWYYTSWILLASLLLARVTAVMLRLVPSQRKRSLLATSLAWVCLLVVAAAWVKVSFLGMYRRPVSVQPALYDQVAKTKGLHTAFSFDKPGYIAYYSSIRVITLDNLMGSMAFERELVSEGVNSYASNRGVDTFIGPPVPLDWAGYNSFCQKLYLDSVLFHCAQINSEEWMPVSVDVYSRIPHAYVGTLQLDPKQLLWTMKEQVSFWRIVPTDRQAQPGP